MQFPVHKYGLTFRLVEETDAEFILSLRTDKKRARHLSYTENDLQKQVDWIREYKKREEASIEYYVLFTDENNEPAGVLRAYDITDSTFTSGSWLIKSGCDEFVGLKSDLFMVEFAQEKLPGILWIFDVRKDNKKVVRFHKKFATITGEDEVNYHFALPADDAQRKARFLTSIIHPTT